MKILNAQQIKEIDNCTVRVQNISSIHLMERAAIVVVQKLLDNLSLKNGVDIYCGKGNNGGDGLAIARMLADRGFNVRVLIVQYTPSASQDFLINYEKLKTQSNIKTIQHIETENDLKIEINKDNVCIDAILGSGVNKPTDGIIRKTIKYMNDHYSKIFSIDVPSGLFLDVPNSPEDVIITAHYTFTFQLPKFSFLFPENADFVGHWEVLNIGLSEECIEKYTTDFFCIDKNLVKSVYVPRKKVSAKWDYGHCLIVAGSSNMPGAAVLCVSSALRSGCGLVSIHSVDKVTSIVLTHHPECLLSVDEADEYISHIPQLKKYSAIAFGSGTGNHTNTYSALKTLLLKTEKQKIIIDADGLNVMAQHSELFDHLPKGQCIITPHIKEFDRIFGEQKNHYCRIQKAKNAAKELGIVVVLKSAYTAVALPSGKVYFNTVANAAMAKGGSGDLLTGLIAGLCARGYTIENAAILATYIHSLAGRFAAEHIHPDCVIPSDVIAYLSQAFSTIEDE